MYIKKSSPLPLLVLGTFIMSGLFVTYSAVDFVVKIML